MMYGNDFINFGSILNAIKSKIYLTFVPTCNNKAVPDIGTAVTFYLATARFVASYYYDYRF